MSKLTEKQKRFCNEYILDYNGTQAAIRAGYNKNSANTHASRMLTKANIRAYIESIIKKVTNKLEITQERTMMEIARIAFSDTRKFFDSDGCLKAIPDLDDDAAGALSSIDITEEHEWVDGVKKPAGYTKKIKLWDKTKGLEMLAKHFKIYSDAPVQNNVVKVGYGEEED